MSKKKPVPGPPWNLQQIPLFTAICEEVTRQLGNVSPLERQMNAMLEAANMIVREFASAEKTVDPDMGLKSWLASDGTGKSSLYMASVIGGFSREYAHPYDPADFGRCLGLLKAVPEFRDKLPMMSDKSKVWELLVSSWDELESLYKEEYPSGKAPKCFGRMREILDAGGDR